MPPKAKKKKKCENTLNLSETDAVAPRARKRKWSDADFSHIGPSEAPKNKKVRYKTHIFNQSVTFGR